MAKLWPAALVLALGLAGFGWHSCRAHSRHVAAEKRAEIEQASAEHARDLELQTDAAHARAALFDCDTRYRDATDWGAYCRRELRRLAEMERLGDE